MTLHVAKRSKAGHSALMTRHSTGVRLPVDIVDQIRRIADREERSINAQITVMLRDWLEANELEPAR